MRDSLQERFIWQDATIEVQVSVFGVVSVEITCRKYHAVLTPKEFAQLAYACIDAEAKKLDS